MTVGILPYSEGTVFSIPLRNGGFARGIVARAAPEAACIFAFFFGPKMLSPGELGFESVQPEKASMSLILSDLGLLNGEWPLIGMLPDWRRDAWKMPDFVRRDPIGKRAWRVRYSDDDPSKIESEEPVEFDNNLPDNWSAGYGVAELKLTKSLG